MFHVIINRIVFHYGNIKTNLKKHTFSKLSFIDLLVTAYHTKVVEHNITSPELILSIKFWSGLSISHNFVSF